MGKRFSRPARPDADTRRALLLILTALEQHSRALRTLLAKTGRPELEGLLTSFARRERALREAAWRLRARAAPGAAGPTDRRRGTADGVARQGVLPLPAPSASARHPGPGLGSGLHPNGTDHNGAGQPSGTPPIAPMSPAQWGVGRTSGGRATEDDRRSLDDQGRKR